MKKLFLIFCILFSACSFENSKDAGKIGEKSVEISAKDLLGNSVKLANDSTNLKVLVFFKNGCASCLKELPLLDKFCKENNGKISVYAINSNDSLEVIKYLSEQFNFERVRILKDELKITSDNYSVFATPTTIIIKDGLIKDRILGEKEWEDLHLKLVSLL